MKKAISFSPTFNPTSKTLDFSGYSGFNLDKLFAVIDVTQNQIIYAVGQPTYGLASVSGSVITLVYNTSALSASDVLLVLYDETDFVKLTDGTNNALINSNGSLTIAGVSPIGSSPVNPPVGVSGVDAGGLKRSILTDTSGRLEIDTVQSLPLPNNAATSALQTTGNTYLAQIVTNTGAQAQDFQSTGTITALNGTVSVTGQGVYTVTISLTGTWTGTVVFEGQTPDGVWNGLPANTLANTVPFSTAASASVNGVYIITGGGFLNIRARASTAVTGTINVALDGSLSQQTIYAGQMGTWATQIADGTTPSKKTTVSNVPAARNSNALVTQPAYQTLFKTAFPNAMSGADSTYFTTVATGSGQTINQTGGNLVITAGTTTNAETILRSTQSFTGSMITRVQNILSQRIVNNNFFVELVDIIGDNLVASASSATSLTVTISNNPFTAVNVGQSMYIGNLAAGLVGVPGRYAIASVSGNNVTFTVAGFTISSGTCSLFGWNYYQQQFTAAVATNVAYDAQNRGWNSGQTTATINTTASPGTLTIMTNNDGNAYLMDQLVASSATNQITVRASRNVHLPDENTALYLQIRCLNGSTAPASTTTWTIGQVSVENYSPTSVVINDIKVQGFGNSTPVSVSNTPATTISSGTVTTVSSVTSDQLAIPGIIADVASAALTTTTTTATLTPTFGNSYQVNIPVTVVSGTSPTLDVQIQESADTGTNWYAVYDFPRITATGSYNSPPLPLTGNRVRYVQTVSGTTPSFTRAINRLQASQSYPMYRQMIDRTIVLTTLSSTTASLFTQGCKNAQLVVNIGAATTTPAIQLQGSDDAGLTWYAVGTPLTAVANSTVQLTVTNMTSQFMRAIVTTAGSAVTAGYVLVRGF